MRRKSILNAENNSVLFTLTCYNNDVAIIYCIDEEGRWKWDVNNKLDLSRTTITCFITYRQQYDKMIKRNYLKKRKRERLSGEFGSHGWNYWVIISLVLGVSYSRCNTLICLVIFRRGQTMNSMRTIKTIEFRFLVNVNGVSSNCLILACK